ncbi:MAG TPA: hypothetical protein DEO85_04540 [Maritimibacter sp.]|nr:hypothetical protein [Maritimibacter sp.]
MTEGDGEQTGMPENGQLSLFRIHRQLANEMRRAADDCHDLQILTSKLLEKLHHPDLTSEYQMLQNLDRLHQTLRDLSRLSKSVSDQTADHPVSSAGVLAAIHLTSLRDRMFPEFSSYRADESSDDLTLF